MAVAAYVPLVSLTHVLNNLQHSAQVRRLNLDKKQVETLKEDAHFMLDFIEVHSQGKVQGLEGLWGLISEVAAEVEAMIDSHVVNQLRRRKSGEDIGDMSLLSFHSDMDRAIQKIISLKRKLSVGKNEDASLQVEEKSPGSVSQLAGSLLPSSSSKNVVVGFDEHVIQIMDELTASARAPDLQIIPIVGMGGIGKTTLAHTVYGNPCIVDHFDTRIWVTISQDYSVEQILLSLLLKGEEKESDESLAIVGERVYKNLFGRRFLVVMDDLWSMEAWGDLRRFFPNNQNGSRIMITSRLLHLANSLGSRNPYSMAFLDDDQSWNLLCQTIFGKEACPFPELEEIGRELVKTCRGLPLLIVVIGRQLVRSKMTRENWQTVSKSVNSLGDLEDDEHCLKILSLSYNNLPIHLKPCFLYLRVYKEDAKIYASGLTKWWIAEGFIKPMEHRSLEETAEEYLRDLIGRNLIFTRERTVCGDIETCGIHDLLRDLCLRESSNEQFADFRKVLSCKDFRMLDKKCILCNGSITDEGEFIRLKFLHIHCLDLVHWRADNTNFPSLEVLVLERLYSLEEIPLGIGDIATLQKITLDHCGKSVVDSAKNIWEEQESMGNESLEIYVIGRIKYKIGSSVYKPRLMPLRHKTRRMTTTIRHAMQ